MRFRFPFPSTCRPSSSAALAIVLTLLLPVQGTLAQATSQDLFQRALRMERVEGDLNGAIQLYQQVAGMGDRSLAARALIRMGESYERLGAQGARDAYTRVLNDFGDQTEEAALARTRLAELEMEAPVAAPTALSPASLTMRLAWADPGVDLEGQPTPDGKWISFVDWGTGGNLALRNLASGEKRLLTSGADDEHYALLSTISPDGTLVAYFWTPSWWHSQLRVMGIDGSGQKTLLANPDSTIDYLEPFGWTPDSRQVFTKLTLLNGNTQLVLVSVVDGSMRLLREIPGDAGNVLRAAISPDGRWVAYDLRGGSGLTPRDIHLLAVETGEDRVVAGHPAEEGAPLFTPDSRHLLFSSDRSGSVDLWALPLKDGRPTGDPFPVKRGMGPGFTPMGFSSDGSLFIGVEVGGGDIYTAQVDPSTGKLTGEPAKAVDSFDGLNTAPHWSQDGSRMAYRSRRTLQSLGQFFRFVVRDMETGAEWIPAPDLRANEQWARPRLSPDGAKMVSHRAGSPAMGMGLVVMDVASGRWDLLGSGSEPGGAEWGRDSQTIYFGGAGEPGATPAEGLEVNLWRLDLSSMTGEVAFDFGEHVPELLWSLSPDRNQIAYVAGNLQTGRVLMVGELATGTRREIHRVAPPDFIAESTGLTWTEDGSHILFALEDSAPWEERQNRELLSVPVAGGAAFSTGLTMEELRHVVLHPDGQRIGFSAGPHTNAQIWVMENLFSGGGTLMGVTNAPEKEAALPVPHHPPLMARTGRRATLRGTVGG